MQGERHDSEMGSATRRAKVDLVLTETLEDQGMKKEPVLIDQMKGTMKKNFKILEDHMDRGVTKIERTLDNNVAQFLRSRWKRKWLSLRRRWTDS